jgi:O-methyltransferase
MKLLSDQVDEREVSVVLRELERVLTAIVPGDVTEFGCYVGTTSVYLAERLKDTGRTLWLYDSFEGLPPKTAEDSSPAGEQFKTGELLATKKQLILNLKQAHVPMPKITKGWFSELTAADVPERVAFAFLDGDYYHSVKDPLKLLWPRLSPGAIVVVDDYANEALPGAARAVDEWLQGHQATIKVEHSLAILQLPS